MMLLWEPTFLQKAAQLNLNLECRVICKIHNLSLILLLSMSKIQWGSHHGSEFIPGDVPRRRRRRRRRHHRHLPFSSCVLQSQRFFGGVSVSRATV